MAMRRQHLWQLTLFRWTSLWPSRDEGVGRMQLVWLLQAVWTWDFLPACLPSCQCSYQTWDFRRILRRLNLSLDFGLSARYSRLFDLVRTAVYHLLLIIPYQLQLTRILTIKLWKTSKTAVNLWAHKRYFQQIHMNWLRDEIAEPKKCKQWGGRNNAKISSKFQIIFSVRTYIGWTERLLAIEELKSLQKFSSLPLLYRPASSLKTHCTCSTGE